MSRAPSASTLMDGFRVLGVAIRREPWVFTLSTLGSVLFGALTVADAWVLGWSTDHVVLPAFETGTTTTGGLVAILALFLGVAILRAVGIVARRLGAGIMQYRMQAAYRREVTRQYLTLPMSWHQRHPTGELLSNANSDVEAAWAPIAPLPMAVGTLAMMVIAIVQMLFTDLAMALVGLLVFPLVMLVNVVFQRLSSPIFTRIQALRAELSEIAHESFDGAMVVKTLGRESEETDRFAAKARDLRDEGIRAGRIRAAFDPFLESLPNLGVLAVLGVGVLRVQLGDGRSGRRGHGRLPADDRGLPDPVDRLAARGVPALGGRLHAGAPGPRHGQRDDVRRRRGWRRRRPRAPRSRSTTSATPTRPASALLDGLDFTVEPGRTVAVVGATASGKSTLTSLVTRLVDPQSGSIRVDGQDLRDLAPGRARRSTWPWCRRARSSSTTPCAAT